MEDRCKDLSKKCYNDKECDKIWSDNYNKCQKFQIENSLECYINNL